MNIVCFALAAYEWKSIDEWADYYLKLGVDAFVITMLEPWRYEGKLLVDPRFQFRSHRPEDDQDDLCNEFIEEAKEKYDWALFIDVDEFIVLKNGCRTLPEFLAKFSDYNAVEFCWKIFGSIEEQSAPKSSIIQRFIHCQEEIGDRGKHIVNLKKIPSYGRFLDVHDLMKPSPDGKILVKLENVVDVCRRTACLKMTSPKEKSSEAYIAHYMLKTPEEFEVKRRSYEELLGMNIKWQFQIDKEANRALDYSLVSFIETGSFNASKLAVKALDNSDEFILTDKQKIAISSLSLDDPPASVDKLIAFNGHDFKKEKGCNIWMSDGLVFKSIWTGRHLDRENPHQCIFLDKCKEGEHLLRDANIPHARCLGMFSVRNANGWMWNGIIQEFLDGWRIFRDTEEDIALAENIAKLLAANRIVDTDFHLNNIMFNERTGQWKLVDLESFRKMSISYNDAVEQMMKMMRVHLEMASRS